MSLSFSKMAYYDGCWLSCYVITMRTEFQPKIKQKTENGNVNKKETRISFVTHRRAQFSLIL